MYIWLQTSIAGGEGEGEVTQSCPTLCNPMDCSLPGSSIHGILQARILEQVAISFSRGSSRTQDQTQVSRIGGRHFNFWASCHKTQWFSLWNRPKKQWRAQSAREIDIVLPQCYWKKWLKKEINTKDSVLFSKFLFYTPLMIKYVLMILATTCELVIAPPQKKSVKQASLQNVIHNPPSDISHWMPHKVPQSLEGPS